MCPYEYKQLILVTLGFILKVQRSEVQACARRKNRGWRVWVRVQVRQVIGQNEPSANLLCFKNGEGAKSETACGCICLSSPGFPPASLACECLFVLQREKQEVSFLHFA